MLRQYAKVESCSGGVARLRVERPVTCGQCRKHGGCGAWWLDQALSRRSRVFRIPVPGPLEAGRSVCVAMHERHLLEAAVYQYCLPLIGLLAGALLLAPWGDPASATGAAGGLAGGLLLARRLALRTGEQRLWVEDPAQDPGAPGDRGPGFARESGEFKLPRHDR